MVDTGIASMSEKVWAAVQSIAPPRKPLRYIINTSHPEHTGGNDVIAPTGRSFPFREADYTAGPQGAIDTTARRWSRHSNVLNRMSAPDRGTAADAAEERGRTTRTRSLRSASTSTTSRSSSRTFRATPMATASCCSGSRMSSASATCST